MYNFVAGGCYKRQSSSANNIFPCVCGRIYRHYRSLYTHQKQECGKDPQFKCSHCSALYRHKHRLREHLVKKHNIYVNNAANSTNNL